MGVVIRKYCNPKIRRFKCPGLQSAPKPNATIKSIRSRFLSFNRFLWDQYKNMFICGIKAKQKSSGYFHTVILVWKFWHFDYRTWIWNCVHFFACTFCYYGKTCNTLTWSNKGRHYLYFKCLEFQHPKKHTATGCVKHLKLFFAKRIYTFWSTSFEVPRQTNTDSMKCVYIHCKEM